MRTIINDGECIKRYMNVWGNLFASCCIAYPTLQRTPFPFHPHLFVYYNRDTIRVKTLLNRQHQGFQIASNPSIFRRSFDKRILFSSPNDNTPLSFSRALSNIVLRIFPMPSTNLLLLLLLFLLFHSLFLAQSCR